MILPKVGRPEKYLIRLGHGIAVGVRELGVAPWVDVWIRYEGRCVFVFDDPYAQA